MIEMSATICFMEFGRGENDSNKWQVHGIQASRLLLWYTQIVNLQ